MGTWIAPIGIWWRRSNRQARSRPSSMPAVALRPICATAAAATPNPPPFSLTGLSLTDQAGNLPAGEHVDSDQEHEHAEQERHHREGLLPAGHAVRALTRGGVGGWGGGAVDVGLSLGIGHAAIVRAGRSGGVGVWRTPRS